MEFGGRGNVRQKVDADDRIIRRASRFKNLRLDVPHVKDKVHDRKMNNVQRTCGKIQRKIWNRVRELKIEVLSKIMVVPVLMYGMK